MNLTNGLIGFAPDVIGSEQTMPGIKILTNKESKLSYPQWIKQDQNRNKQPQPTDRHPTSFVLFQPNLKHQDIPEKSRIIAFPFQMHLPFFTNVFHVKKTFLL